MKWQLGTSQIELGLLVASERQSSSDGTSHEMCLTQTSGTSWTVAWSFPLHSKPLDSTSQASAVGCAGLPSTPTTRDYASQEIAALLAAASFLEA